MMTQYVGVIRKELSAVMTPTGPQMQQNIDAKRIPDMTPEQFGQIGVRRQQRYFDSDKYEPATESGMMSSQYPETMAMRQAYEGARKRGVIGQQIGQGVGGAIGVLGGLVSLANAGAAGQDAITGGVNAAQTGQYLTQQTQPRIGNIMGRMGAATASPVKVERQKTFDEAPMVASPTNTPAPTPTPAPVAVAPPRNLPSDPRQIFNTNYAGVNRLRQRANEFIGVNPYAQEGDYSAVNTSQENPFNPMMMHPSQLSPVTPAGTLRLTNPDGTPYQSPQQQVAVAEPTVSPTPSADDVGQTLFDEAFNPGKTGAQEQIEASQQSAEDVGNALKKKMLKAEVLGRQAAYDDFVKMFVEVKS